MLVLTRKLMERLYIGEDICVTVVRLEGGQVRLGIEAPRHIPVVRAELVTDRVIGPPPSSSPSPTPSPSPSPSPTTRHDTPELRIPRAVSPGIGIRRRGPSQ